MDYESLSDERLVKDVIRGSDVAAAALFDRYWVEAWQVAYRIAGSRALADDIAQEAMIRAFRALQTFERRSAFGTWLHRIVVNQALNSVRAQERHRTDESDSEPVTQWETDTLDHSAAAIVAAVGSLSPDKRLVVVLRHWIGMTPSEIADALELPVGTVNSRLARGIESLQGQLEVLK